VSLVWIDHNAYESSATSSAPLTSTRRPCSNSPWRPSAGLWRQEAREGGPQLRPRTPGAAVGRFWSRTRVFVNNLPWLKEEGKVRMCDRSLATAVLFDQFPEKKRGQALRLARVFA